MSFASEAREAAQQFVEESRREELDEISRRIRELRQKESSAVAAREYRRATALANERIRQQEVYKVAYGRIVGCAP